MLRALLTDMKEMAFAAELPSRSQTKREGKYSVL